MRVPASPRQLLDVRVFPPHPQPTQRADHPIADRLHQLRRAHHHVVYEQVAADAPKHVGGILAALGITGDPVAIQRTVEALGPREVCPHGRTDPLLARRKGVGCHAEHLTAAATAAIDRHFEIVRLEDSTGWFERFGRDHFGADGFRFDFRGVAKVLDRQGHHDPASRTSSSYDDLYDDPETLALFHELYAGDLRQNGYALRRPCAATT